jgi:hypothetical protein
MNPSNLMLFLLYGFILLWALAWLWAFWRIASDTLVGMINGVFTLRGLGWSALCALLALIPLWIAALVWSEFLGVLPQ